MIVVGGGCSHKLTDIDGDADIYNLLLYEWIEEYCRYRRRAFRETEIIGTGCCDELTIRRRGGRGI